MCDNLPSTPVDVLDISTAELKKEIFRLVDQAIDTGSWLYPYKDAATSLEEMTVSDMAYWVYKCAHPITNYEKGYLTHFVGDPSLVKLPNGFEKSHSITFGVIGDLLYADGLEFSKDQLFSGVSDLLFEQTISFANFESPVTVQPLKKEVIGDKEAPVECSNYNQFVTLTSHGSKHFTVLNIANNHIADMGIEGILTTLKSFDEAGVLGIGVNNSPGEYEKGKILEVEGIKLGFVSSTFGLNGHILPEGETYRVNSSKLLSKHFEADISLLKKQIDYCRAEECDFIVASVHWGFEFEFFPRRRQIETARALAEYGADAIICHHPHVIQPVEYYKTKRDPDRVVTIAYSLGSATWGFSAPHLVLSLIQNLRITKGVFRGRDTTYIETAKITPVFRSITADSGRVITRIEKLQDHMDDSPHSAEYIEKIKYYADMVLDHSQFGYSENVAV